MWKRAALLGILVGSLLSFSVGYALADVHATDRSSKAVAAVKHDPAAASSTPASDTPPPPPEPTPPPAPPPVHPSFAALASRVQAIVSPTGGQFGITLIELGGPAPRSWQRNGSVTMTAASHSPLPALMRPRHRAPARHPTPPARLANDDCS